MKLNIEVEIAEHEIHLATELFTALRAFGANVKMTPGPNGGAPPQPITPAPAPPPPAMQQQQQYQQQQPPPQQYQQPPPQQYQQPPPQQQHQQQQPPPQQQQQQQQAPPPQQQAPQQKPPQQQPPPQQQQQQQLPPQQAQDALPPGASKPVFEALLRRLSDETQHEQVFNELLALLAQNERMPAGPGELLEAYEAVALNPQMVLNGESTVPYMSLLPNLPEPYKTSVKTGLISKVVQLLGKKRPVGSDRTPFFVHAEAFAMLVKIGFVSVDGAAQTMDRMLHKGEQRTAAVTMLGKTVEMCADKLLQQCKPDVLAALYKSLQDHVKEDVFKYDLDWIIGGMGWAPLDGSEAAPPATA